MRELSLFTACLLLSAIFFSCKKTTPEAPKPVTIGSVQLQQQNGTDCDIADTLDRMDCARLNLRWPKVEQGSQVLANSVDQWATRHLSAVMGASTEGTNNAISIDAAAKVFFDEHQKYGKSVMSGGWVAESDYLVLHNDGRYLTLEITGYTYQGGAHGNAVAAVATFEVQTGKQLGWDDLVTDKAAVKNLAETQFRETRIDIFQPTNGIEPFEFDETMPFELAQNVGLVQEGIYCHYVPYEVGPYAIGSTQMIIPFAALGALSKIKAPVQSAPNSSSIRTAPVFDFPHFGRFDLSAWKKMPTRLQTGGDVAIASTIYEKNRVLLVIDTTDMGEYGFKIEHKLIGPDSAVQKTRLLEFSNDPYALTETVIDYTVTPAKKYTRRQDLNKHYSQIKPLPAMATGAGWQEDAANAGGVQQKLPEEKPVDKPVVRKKSSTAKTAPVTAPTVTLKQNGDILVNGKKVYGLENLRKQLQAQLLTYDVLPTKVNFKTVGATGMGMRAEVNTLIDESIAGAKWARKKTAIAALNAAIGKKLNQPTKLAPGTFQTSGRYAYISARPLQADGNPINYSLTDYVRDLSTDWFTDNAIGLLLYEKGAWKVQAYTIGVTQAPVNTWVSKYGAPRGMFGK